MVQAPQKFRLGWALCCLFLLSHPGLANAQGIDWEGAIAPGGSGTISNISDAQTNLPGVRVIPSNPRTPSRPGCDEDLANSGRTVGSLTAAGNCNRKTPLIVFQGGEVKGLVFEFGR